MDMSSITAILSNTKAALDIINIIRNSSASLSDAERNLKLAELTNAVIDIKLKCASMREELFEKDVEISKLKEQLNTKGQLKYETPFYWKIIDGKKESRYCQKCWDYEKKDIHLIELSSGIWQCNVCKNVYTDANRVKEHLQRTPETEYDPFSNL